MQPADLVQSLMLKWEERRDCGRPIAPEELCSDCPELLPELRRRVAILQSADALLDTSDGQVERSLASTIDTDRTKKPAGPSHWPSIPGYEILGELGRGGMGVVYQARHIELKRLVALKMIRGSDASPEELARFRTEAQAVARLQHPGIVQIHEIGEHADSPYLAFELVEGGSLASQLKGEPQQPRAAAELVEKLARAMHAAHQRGIVHRDLKPANVLLAVSDQRPAVSQANPGSNAFALKADGRSLIAPKITDFGLARFADSDSGQTKTGQVMGTPSYMAPEQAAGQVKALGPLVDVYALGAILYEMVTGRPPFKGASVLDTLEQVRTQEPLPPRQLIAKLPRDLETICLKCLHKEPAKRYASAEALADDLRRYLDGVPITARPVGRVERTWRWCRRNPAVAGLTATVFLTLSIGILAASLLAMEAHRQADAATHHAKTAKDNEQLAMQREEEAEDYLVQSLLRAVGHEGGKVDEREIQAWREVAALPRDSMRWRLLRHGFADEATARRLAGRIDLAVLALSGLSLERRGHLLRELATVLAAKQSAPAVRYAAALGVHALRSADARLNELAAEQLVEAIEKAGTADQMNPYLVPFTDLLVTIGPSGAPLAGRAVRKMSIELARATASALPQFAHSLHRIAQKYPTDEAMAMIEPTVRQLHHYFIGSLGSNSIAPFLYPAMPLMALLPAEKARDLTKTLLNSVTSRLAAPSGYLPVATVDSSVSAILWHMKWVDEQDRDRLLGGAVNGITSFVLRGQSGDQFPYLSALHRLTPFLNKQTQGQMVYSLLNRITQSGGRDSLTGSFLANVLGKFDPEFSWTVLTRLAPQTTGGTMQFELGMSFLFGSAARRLTPAQQRTAVSLVAAHLVGARTSAARRCLVAIAEAIAPDLPPEPARELLIQIRRRPAGNPFQVAPDSRMEANVILILLGRLEPSDAAQFAASTINDLTSLLAGPQLRNDADALVRQALVMGRYLADEERDNLTNKLHERLAAVAPTSSDWASSCRGLKELFAGLSEEQAKPVIRRLVEALEQITDEGKFWVTADALAASIPCCQAKWQEEWGAQVAPAVARRLRVEGKPATHTAAGNIAIACKLLAVLPGQQASEWAAFIHELILDRMVATTHEGAQAELSRLIEPLPPYLRSPNLPSQAGRTLELARQNTHHFILRALSAAWMQLAPHLPDDVRQTQAAALLAHVQTAARQANTEGDRLPLESAAFALAPFLSSSDRAHMLVSQADAIVLRMNVDALRDARWHVERLGPIVNAMDEAKLARLLRDPALRGDARGLVQRRLVQLAAPPSLEAQQFAAVSGLGDWGPDGSARILLGVLLAHRVHAESDRFVSVWDFTEWAQAKGLAHK